MSGTGVLLLSVSGTDAVLDLQVLDTVEDIKHETRIGIESFIVKEDDDGIFAVSLYAFAWCLSGT